MEGAPHGSRVAGVCAWWFLDDELDQVKSWYMNGLVLASTRDNQQSPVNPIYF